jgi:hypothetical protein
MEAAAIAKLDAIAKTKRITFAKKPEKPKIAHKKAEEAVAATQTASIQVPVFNTRVQIFMLSTGDDPGSEAEISGGIQFNNIIGDPDIKSINTDLPVVSAWANENGGFGRLLADHNKATTVLPASFLGVVYESDAFGNDVILNYPVDFNNPANLQYANGDAWQVQSRNSDDNRYCVNLWWQVTQTS